MLLKWIIETFDGGIRHYKQSVNMSVWLNSSSAWTS